MTTVYRHWKLDATIIIGDDSSLLDVGIDNSDVNWIKQEDNHRWF